MASIVVACAPFGADPSASPSPSGVPIGRPPSQVAGRADTWREPVTTQRTVDAGATASTAPTTEAPPSTTTTTGVPEDGRDAAGALPDVPVTVGAPPVTDAPEPVASADGLVAMRAQLAHPALAPLASERSRELAGAAIELVRYDWEVLLPGWQLQFHDGRSGVRGLTFTERRSIEVYVRPTDSPASLAHVVAHELGHAVDLTLLDDSDRTTWLATRGLGRATIWFPHAAGVSDFASGAGDFAESFAWLFGPASQWSGELGPPPTPVQAGALLQLVGG